MSLQILTLQNINTSHHISLKKASYQTKNRLQNLSSHIQNTYKSTTYIIISTLYTIVFISITFCFYTRSSDSLNLFIPYMSDHHRQKGFLCHRSTTLEFTALLILETRLLSLPIFRSRLKTHICTSSKLRSLPRQFPISFDCLPGFWFLLYSHLMPCFASLQLTYTFKTRTEDKKLRIKARVLCVYYFDY